MKLHNTLTKQTDEFAPLVDKQVGIYSCGPTVYDHIHIGNLSSFIFADTLRRALQIADNEVKHVMNFTDVDDKTIRRSQEKYPGEDPLQALLKLTTDYSQVFLDDMAAVGNDVDAISFVKATESIAAMQQLIRELHAAGFAYIADDGVYFSIEAYQKSGKIYGQLTEITASSTSAARIQNDEYDKESAHDFALWKKQKANEPGWDFELDGQDLKGRPGWHIECSAMSAAALGQPFDIHTGGVDLIFPHHENEIAQSTAGKDSAYASFFVHNEHLLVDDQKMSKSLNNFHTLKDIRDKGFDPLAFRLLVLQAHYRTQAHFSWANLEAAQNRLQGYRAMAALQWQLKDQPAQASSNFENAAQELKQYLEDDLNTPLALARLSAFSDLLSDELISKANQHDFATFLQTIDGLLGLQLSSVNDINDKQRQLIDDRESARQTQDWAKSDELRDRLVEQGIGLRDTPHGPIWFRL